MLSHFNNMSPIGSVFTPDTGVSFNSNSKTEWKMGNTYIK